MSLRVVSVVSKHPTISSLLFAVLVVQYVNSKKVDEVLSECNLLT